MCQGEFEFVPARVAQYDR